MFLLAVLVAFGQDPAFDTIPFEQWLKGGQETRFRWSVRVFPARLTVHQRLAVDLSVEVDGSEFLKREGKAPLVVFVEIRDQANRVYRTHSALNTGELKKTADLAAVNLAETLFITPGDYQVAVALYDAASDEHSLKRMKLHVPEIPRDPLREAWHGTEAVEFVIADDAPERWYLPDISSRLNLPVKTERPVRVEVVVNESPTEKAMGRTGRVSRRNMGNLIPALKVLSQMDLRNGSLNVTLLDLERRKVSFTQEDAGKLDWTRLRAALLENDPNSIDVHALENHEQNAQFFVSEVRRRLEGTETNGDVPLGLTAEPARVLIVLSGPMAFPKGQDLRPIEATAEPGSRVYYIRYYPPVAGPVPGIIGPAGRGGRGMRPTPPNIVRGGTSTEDSLGQTLKPLAPRVFNVTTPLEFRSALAAIIGEISQLK